MEHYVVRDLATSKVRWRVGPVPDGSAAGQVLPAGLVAEVVTAVELAQATADAIADVADKVPDQSGSSQEGE